MTRNLKEKMRPFKLIIFDCDGVLVDSERLTNQVFIDMLAVEGVNITLHEIMENYVGIPLQNGIAILEKLHQFKLPEDFITEFKQQSMAVLESDLRPISGVEKVIRNLQIPFCVASNSHTEKVCAMLKITGLFDYFNGKIITARQVKHPKPAPDIYLYAARAFNIAPSDCLVIEDTTVGVTAAKVAGMTVLGYAAQTSATRLLEAGAHHVFKAMKELPMLIQQGKNPITIQNSL
jgi:HAD superfamily hydrolase (TIGR01509 family)